MIFLIFLYQRWIYPVDYKRVNEFGQGGDDSLQDQQKDEQQKDEQQKDEQQKDEQQKDELDEPKSLQNKKED